MVLAGACVLFVDQAWKVAPRCCVEDCNADLIDTSWEICFGQKR